MVSGVVMAKKNAV